jgi:hypothetical protein
MILCDGHVHIHGAFPIDLFLSAALKNFAAYSKGISRVDQNIQYVLWLTESAGTSKFSELLDCCAISNCRSDSGWRIRSTEDDISLVANQNDDEIILIAGRQVVSAENVEVLALGMHDTIGDGTPLSEAIEYILSANALPVLPWGFGKWFGKRGGIIEYHINNTEHIFIGDNGGRLAGLPEPKLIKLARKKNISILPGSDPLPFPDEYQRVASYGWIQDSVISLSRPGESLKECLRNRETSKAQFGDLQPIGKFLGNQFKMQFHKRLRRRYS